MNILLTLQNNMDIYDIKEMSIFDKIWSEFEALLDSVWSSLVRIIFGAIIFDRSNSILARSDPE